MSKRIHPAALAAQRDLFGLSPATKKPTPRKKPQDRHPESAVRRLERMLTTREAAERAEAERIREAIEANGGTLPDGVPIEKARPTEDVIYFVGPDGKRTKASELPQVPVSSTPSYKTRGEVYPARDEAPKTLEQRVLIQLEKVIARAPRYTWRDAERDVMAYYAKPAPIGLPPDPPPTKQQLRDMLESKMTEQAANSLSFCIVSDAVEKHLTGLEAKAFGERVLKQALAEMPVRVDFCKAITTDAIKKIEEYAARLIERCAKAETAGGAA